MNVEQVSDQKTVKVTITLLQHLQSQQLHICTGRHAHRHLTFIPHSNWNRPRTQRHQYRDGVGKQPGHRATRSASWATAGPNTTHFIGTSSEGTAQLGSLFLLTLLSPQLPIKPSSNLQTMMNENYLEALSTQALHNLVSVQHTTRFFFLFPTQADTLV